MKVVFETPVNNSLSLGKHFSNNIFKYSGNLSFILRLIIKHIHLICKNIPPICICSFEIFNKYRHPIPKKGDTNLLFFTNGKNVHFLKSSPVFSSVSIFILCQSNQWSIIIWCSYLYGIDIRLIIILHLYQSSIFPSAKCLCSCIFS